MHRFLWKALLIASVAQPCVAALGENEASVEVDRMAMAARVLRQAQPSYSVHTLTTQTGVQIRQYVNATGSVFAVRWDGPFMPDLRQLLGGHFDALVREEARVPHAGHSKVTVSSPEVVIHSGGHMRSFHGFAYRPADFPAGVSPSELF
jgi:Protein of unknown function (DUF2844)